VALLSALRNLNIAASHAEPLDFSARSSSMEVRTAGEISQLKSEYVKENCVHFPSRATKSRREHLLLLTTICANIIVRLPFTIAAFGKPKKRLDELSGVGSWTLHDLRRTFATYLAELGIPPHIIERILNHSSGATTIYNRHHFLPEMRDALAKWERRLAEMIGEPLS
jgi:integrase